ncbi:FixH family protein [Heyndrickxia sp. NPDC080065]|uniref:FixH family protein n=1 Tax=Heyndrickxia sp. NPDC080065 TaxID=3390568 RepID=UPI003D086471
MKKLYISIIMLFSLFFITACTANTNQSNEKNTKPVEVHIQLPEKITPHQESVLKVHVTQGKENVDDADDIEFEIWKANDRNNSELIKANHEKDGIYNVKKTFSKDGIYYIQTHVTARDMHVMPKKLFVVGNVSEEELKSIKDESESHEGNSDNSHEHHH